MTINLPDYPMSVTQYCLAMNETHFIRVVYSLHHFQVIECDVYVKSPIVYDCLCAVYSGQQYCVKDVSSISILK